MSVIGLDLAANHKKQTGFCIMNENLEVKTFLLFTDNEILEHVKYYNPELIAIDAPLSLPMGRTSLEEKSNIHLRLCDRELLGLGIKFFPITLGPMRKLTERGIKLKQMLENFGYKVIEVFPGATQDILGLVRKNQGINKLREGLISLGIKGIKYEMSDDELDAITCALTGLLYLKGECIELGDKREGILIIPKFKY
jgi:predicted nuclease with RNAse H fold